MTYIYFTTYALLSFVLVLLIIGTLRLLIRLVSKKPHKSKFERKIQSKSSNKVVVPYKSENRILNHFPAMRIEDIPKNRSNFFALRKKDCKKASRLTDYKSKQRVFKAIAKTKFRYTPV